MTGAPSSPSGKTFGPPAVVFQHPRRIWRLALVNAWEDLSRRREDVPPLPRVLVALTPENIDHLLRERPASFVLLSARSRFLEDCLPRVPLWRSRYPRCTFALIDERRRELTPFYWEVGIRCVVSSPREAHLVAAWLAWHLRRLHEPPSAWLDAIWDRLPWAQWAAESNTPPGAAFSSG